MFIRQIKEKHWKHVYRQIAETGSCAPMSLQYDLDIHCNGIRYILRVQPDSHRKIAALQAIAVSPDTSCTLIENSRILSALLELMLYQILQPAKICENP